MKKFLCLCFVVFFIFGCSDISNFKNESSIFLDFDLQNILSKNSNSRNVLDEETSEYQLEISLYNVRKSSVFDKSKATMISTSSPKIENGKVSVGFNNIRVGIKVAISVELYEISASNGKKLIYMGESDIFTVKNNKNIVQVQLKKVQPSDKENPNVILEDFLFFTQNNGVDDIPVETGYVKTDEYIQVTVNDINDTTDLWSYYVKTKAERSFEPGKNYKVSVDLKADEKTVIEVSANRTDMYFTVGTEWETFTFETGLIQMNETSQISIGCGLSKNTYIRNLKIEEFESYLPTLSFNIENYGIKDYLEANIDKPILQVEKEIDESNPENSGCKINLHSTGVTFQIRGYGTPNKLNVATFEMETTNELLTSAPKKVDTELSLNYANSWIDGSEIDSAKPNAYAVYFPLYPEDNEDFVQCAIEGFLQEYKQAPEEPLYIRGFNIQPASSLENTGKTFVIKVGDNFIKSIDDLEVNAPFEKPFEAPFEIGPGGEIVFDVLLANYYGETFGEDNWDDCTRFIYTTESEKVIVEDTLKFKCEVNNYEPTYKLINLSSDTISGQIRLTEDLKVEIVLAEE